MFSNYFLRRGDRTGSAARNDDLQNDCIEVAEGREHFGVAVAQEFRLFKGKFRHRTAQFQCIFSQEKTSGVAFFWSLRTYLKNERGCGRITAFFNSLGLSVHRTVVLQRPDWACVFSLRNKFHMLNCGLPLNSNEIWRAELLNQVDEAKFGVWPGRLD